MEGARQIKKLLDEAIAATDPAARLSLLKQARAHLDEGGVPTLSWQEQDMIGIMKHAAGHPGHVVTLDRLAVQWRNRTPQAEFDAALQGLVSKSLLQAATDGYALTEHGYYL